MKTGVLILHLCVLLQISCGRQFQEGWKPREPALVHENQKKYSEKAPKADELPSKYEIQMEHSEPRPKDNTPNSAIEAQQGIIKIVKVFNLGRRDVRNFEFCSKSRRIYVSFTDKKDDLLYEWDVDTGDLIHTYRLGSGYMADSVAVSPDGNHMVVGCFPLGLNGGCKTLVIGTTGSRESKTLKLTDRTFRPEFNTNNGFYFWVDDRRTAYDLMEKPVPGVEYMEPEVKRRSLLRKLGSDPD